MLNFLTDVQHALIYPFCYLYCVIYQVTTPVFEKGVDRLCWAVYSGSIGIPLIKLCHYSCMGVDGLHNYSKYDCSTCFKANDGLTRKIILQENKMATPEI